MLNYVGPGRRQDAPKNAQDYELQSKYKWHDRYILSMVDWALVGEQVVYCACATISRTCQLSSHFKLSNLGMAEGFDLRRKIIVSGGKDHNRFGCYRKVSDFKDRTITICIDQYLLPNLTS